MHDPCMPCVILDWDIVAACHMADLQVPQQMQMQMQAPVQR